LGRARVRDMMMPVAIRAEIGDREFDRECLRATVRLFLMKLTAKHNDEFDLIQIYFTLYFQRLLIDV